MAVLVSSSQCGVDLLVLQAWCVIQKETRAEVKQPHPRLDHVITKDDSPGGQVLYSGCKTQTKVVVAERLRGTIQELTVLRNKTRAGTGKATN